MKCLSVCLRLHTTHTVHLLYHKMSPKCAFPAFQFSRTLSRASLSRWGGGWRGWHERGASRESVSRSPKRAARAHPILCRWRTTTPVALRGTTRFSPHDFTAAPQRWPTVQSDSEQGSRHNPSISSPLAPMVRSCTSGAVGRSNTKKNS